MPERVERPLRWRQPRRVFVNSMSDLFHPRVTFEFVEEVFSVMERADIHIFQILMKRPGRAASWFEMSERPTRPSNVWMGTSVELQRYAPRIDALARIPASVRFVSAEPLIERLSLDERISKIEWLIVGGESGPDARPMDLEWVRTLRDQALEADVPFFLKQLGGRGDKLGGAKALLDGVRWTQQPDWRV